MPRPTTTTTTIQLIDDGTLDIVLCCSDCGEEMRYTYDPGPDSEERALELRAEYLAQHPDAKDSAANDYADQTLYDEYVEGRIEDADAQHECRAEEAED